MSIGAESTSIFRRVIDPENGAMPTDLARFLSSLDFPASDHQRFAELSAKAQEGSLTPQEADELDGYLHVDSWLAIMRLKAHRSLEAAAGEPPNGKST
jgi:hypothetical protein